MQRVESQQLRELRSRPRGGVIERWVHVARLATETSCQNSSAASDPFQRGLQPGVVARHPHVIPGVRPARWNSRIVRPFT